MNNLFIRIIEGVKIPPSNFPQRKAKVGLPRRTSSSARFREERSAQWQRRNGWSLRRVSLPPQLKRPFANTAQGDNRGSHLEGSKSPW